jgi:glutathione reductase (NADPH)
VSLSHEFDFVVVGAGSAGIRAARTAAEFGARVAVIEASLLGGTCVNLGCVPKKLLCYAAEYGSAFADALGYGWSSRDAVFDWATLIANKDAAISRLNGWYERVLAQADVSVIHGYARLADANTVMVESAAYRAPRIVIATGATPRIAAIPGREFAITSNEAFFLERLPARPVVVGGGYIAVEFASIFHELGSDTALLYRGPLFLRGFDADARRFLADQLRVRGLKLHFDATVRSIRKVGADYRVGLSNDVELNADCVLFATGRTPNTRGLGLAEAGVALSAEGGVIVDEDYRTSLPSVYAIGDVTARLMLTPVALAEARVLVQNLCDGQAKRLDYARVPTTVFSAPNLAAVGLTEADARAAYTQVDVFKKDFSPLKHLLSGRKERAFMKLVVDRVSDRVIGAHMVGADAGEIIQGLAVAMQAGATKADFDATLGIHPTAAEEFVTMRELADL